MFDSHIEFYTTVIIKERSGIFKWERNRIVEAKSHNDFRLIDFRATVIQLLSCIRAMLGRFFSLIT